MIKKISFLLFAALPFALNAQISITAQLPPAGLITRDFLWNLIITNNKEEVAEINIRMNVQDPATGETFMTGNSANIQVGKGIKVINVQNVQPVQYNYNSSDFSRTYLPIGAYMVCYQVYRFEEVLGEECGKLIIEPLSPPLLSMPVDKSTIETPYPQFNWIPPSSVDMFSDLNYDILVTEILEGQSPAEAIQYNSPVYSRMDLKQVTDNYPTSFRALEKDKIYAWQVVARNGLNYAAKTEIWTFKLNSKKDETLVGDNYLLLKDRLEATHRIQKYLLHVQYFSSDAPYESTIVISDENGKTIREVKKKIKQGDNYFEFDLNTGFQTGKVYKVMLTTPTKKQNSLTFSINKN